MAKLIHILPWIVISSMKGRLMLWKVKSSITPTKNAVRMLIAKLSLLKELERSEAAVGSPTT